MSADAEPSAQADVSVTWAIIAYRRPDDLRVMLTELATAPEGVQVMVVNVGDSAHVTEEVTKASVTQLVVPNRGYAAAANAAVAACDTEVVIVSNDDLVGLVAAIPALVGEVHARPQAVVHPQLQRPDGQLSPTVHATGGVLRFALEWIILPELYQCGRWQPLLSRLLGRAGVVEKWRLPTKTEPVPSATAACFAARRSLLVQHPMPEDYFLYWEELDWAVGLRGAGIDVLICPTARVGHRGEATLRGSQQAWFMARGAWMFLRRAHGRRAGIIGWPVVVLWQLRLMLTDLVQGRRRLLRHRLVGLASAIVAPVTAIRSLGKLTRPGDIASGEQSGAPGNRP